MSSNRTHQWRGIIEEYRDRLPVTATTPVVTLREVALPSSPPRCSPSAPVARCT